MPKVSKLGGWSNREVDLGGWTAPRWTRRPHMGPFNYVAPEELTQYPGDEVYRQHDLGYSKITSPYFNFNTADEQLLRGAGNEWPDQLAKGVFFGKKVLDIYNVPTLYKGGYSSPRKPVDSVRPRDVPAYSGTGTYDASAVPFRDFTIDRRRRRGDNVGGAIASGYWGTNYPGKRPPGHGQYGPGGTRGSGARGKFHAEVRYEREPN